MTKPKTQIIILVVVLIYSKTNLIFCDDQTLRDKYYASSDLRREFRTVEEYISARNAILSNPFYTPPSSDVNNNQKNVPKHIPQYLTDTYHSLQSNPFYVPPTNSHHPSNTDSSQSNNEGAALKPRPSYITNENEETWRALQNNPFYVESKLDAKPLDTGVIQQKPTTTATTTTTTTTNNVQRSLLYEFDSICGIERTISSVTHLIALGESVSAHYPWLVAIYNMKTNEFHCGGSLISDKHIISAAHCFPKIDHANYNSKFIITNDLRENDIIRYAKSISLHPDYRPDEAKADIALVVFTRPVGFTSDIAPICLWKKGLNNIGELINQNVRENKIVGWGWDENNNLSESLPREANNLPILDIRACIRDNNKFLNVLGHNSFCAGLKNGTGPCRGDSGSGFIVKRNTRWYLRGVVSATLLENRNDCQITEYTAFTDVAKYTHWIVREIANANKL